MDNELKTMSLTELIALLKSLPAPPSTDEHDQLNKRVSYEILLRTAAQDKK